MPSTIHPVPCQHSHAATIELYPPWPGRFPSCIPSTAARSPAALTVPANGDLGSAAAAGETPPISAEDLPSRRSRLLLAHYPVTRHSRSRSDPDLRITTHEPQAARASDPVTPPHRTRLGRTGGAAVTLCPAWAARSDARPPQSEPL